MLLNSQAIDGCLESNKVEHVQRLLLTSRPANLPCQNWILVNSYCILVLKAVLSSHSDILMDDLKQTHKLFCCWHWDYYGKLLKGPLGP